MKGSPSRREGGPTHPHGNLGFLSQIYSGDGKSSAPEVVGRNAPLLAGWLRPVRAGGTRCLQGQRELSPADRSHLPVSAQGPLRPGRARGIRSGPPDGLPSLPSPVRPDRTALEREVCHVPCPGATRAWPPGSGDTGTIFESHLPQTCVVAMQRLPGHGIGSEKFFMCSRHVSFVRYMHLTSVLLTTACLFVPSWNLPLANVSDKGASSFFLL